MKRPINFDELLNVAKERPDLLGALRRHGIDLRRVGVSSRGAVKYKTTNVQGVPGDLSAVVFMHNASGEWLVCDNKERTGTRYLNAIDTLMKLYGFSFDDAVYSLSGGMPSSPVQAPVPCSLPKVKESPLPFTAPAPKYTAIKRVIAYLCQHRNIPYNVVKALIDAGLIYPSEISLKFDDKEIKNTVCVFPILNEQGKTVGADTVGIRSDMRFKHVISGSSYEYAWGFKAGVENVTNTTPVFYTESCIDAVSLFSLYGKCGVYVSLAGVKPSTFDAVRRRLGGVPVICVDNDEAGERFRLKYSDVYSRIPSIGKDFNDELTAHVRLNIPIELNGKNSISLSPIYYQKRASS